MVKKTRLLVISIQIIRCVSHYSLEKDKNIRFVLPGTLESGMMTGKHTRMKRFLGNGHKISSCE